MKLTSARHFKRSGVTTVVLIGGAVNDPGNYCVNWYNASTCKIWTVRYLSSLVSQTVRMLTLSAHEMISLWKTLPKIFTCLAAMVPRDRWSRGRQSRQVSRFKKSQACSCTRLSLYVGKMICGSGITNVVCFFQLFPCLCVFPLLLVGKLKGIGLFCHSTKKLRVI